VLGGGVGWRRLEEVEFFPCEACSKAKGVNDPTGFALAGILMGLGSAVEEGTPAAVAEIKCPRCGFTQADFKKTGRLGCTACYAAFAEPLEPLLKSMHKDTKHVGKVPQALRQGQERSKHLDALQEELQQAIAVEDFERAAVLRDQIKRLRPAQGNASSV